MRSKQSEIAAQTNFFLKTDDDFREMCNKV